MNSFNALFNDYAKNNSDILREYENPIKIGPNCEEIKQKLQVAIDATAYQYYTEEKLELIQHGCITPIIPHKGSMAVANNDNEFVVDDSGVWFDNECICNFRVFLNAYCILYDDDDNCIKKMYSIKIILSKKSACYNEVDLTKLRNPNFYRRMPEFSNIVVNNGGLFKRYIDIILSACEMAPELVWLHSGWHKIEGKFYYLDNTGAIGFPDVKARGRQELNIGSVGEIKPADMNLLINVAGKHSVMLILYTVISVLYTFYKTAGHPPKTLIFLSGKTNSWKTMLSAALTKILNRSEDIKNAEYTFQGTPAGLEQGIKEHHDLIYLVDDLHTSEDTIKQRRLETNLETLVKLFGDGIKKNRNTDYLDPERAANLNYKVGGGCLLTGEYFTGVESNLSRMIIMEISRKCINSELLACIQSEPDLLLRFYKAFISYATYNQAELINYIKKQLPKVRKDYLAFYSKPRYAESQGYFKVALEILIGFMESIGYQDLENFKQYAATAIDDFIAKSDQISQSQSSEYVIRNAISEYLTNEKTGSSSFDIDIFENGDFICIRPDDARKIVNNWLEEQGQSPRFNSKDVFIKACNSANLIYVSTGEKKENGNVHTRNTHHLKGHGSMRFMFFLKSALKC